MDSEWAQALGTGKASYSEIVLEKARLATSKMIEDIPGVEISADIRYEHAYRTAVLEIRALVLAAVKKGAPQIVSDIVVADEVVPERWVRDGALLWLSAHTPEWLSRWIRKKTHTRRIEKRRIATMQQIDYYGCPHVGIHSPRDQVHIRWMAEQSGQVSNGNSAALP